MAQPVETEEQVRQLALISSNQDSKIADIIVQIYAHEHLSMNSISIGNPQNTYQPHPSLEIIEGYSLRSGYLSPYFAQRFDNGVIKYGNEDLSHQMRQDDTLQTAAFLLLTDVTIDSQQEIVRFMEFAKKVRKPVVIFAPDFNSEALTAMVVNNLKGVAEMVAVKTPIGVDDL